MCYDIKTNLQAQLSRDKRNGDLQAIKEIMESLVPLTDLPIYHTTNYSQPKLLQETRLYRCRLYLYSLQTQTNIKFDG